MLATQCLLQAQAEDLRDQRAGPAEAWRHAKDLILAIIGKIGVAGGTGHVIEYRGEAIRALSMDERMTVCNMSIEAGARAGMVAPDETTFAYLKGTPTRAEGRRLGRRRRATGSTLPSDEGAAFDKSVDIDAATLEPMITYGTHPGMVVPISGRIPEQARRSGVRAATELHGLRRRPAACRRCQVNVVFVGSCTNGRITDLRAAAGVLRGRKVAAGVQMLVVPGSQQIKRQAEAEGLDRMFIDAGAEWRESGCSMCLGMNGDTVAKGQYSRQHQQPQFRRSPGRGCAHPAGQPADGRGLRGARRDHRSARPA